MIERNAPASWAPACLIEEYEQLNERIRQHGAGSVEFYPRLPTLEAVDVLCRLLSREDMRSAWATLERAPVEPRIFERSSFKDISVPHRYWTAIKVAMSDFAAAPKRTAKAKRDSLQKIAEQARALIGSINDDPDAAAIDGRVPKNRASSQHMRLRTEDCADWPSSPWFHDFLGGDASEARELSRAAMSSPEWEAAPLEQRFAFWTRALYSSSLTDLLDHFAGWVEQESNNAPEIKQPGRGSQALVAFLARRLSELALELHGTPLDEAVGIIVTAAVDHHTPLTRDDVRAYRRQGGAKMVLIK